MFTGDAKTENALLWQLENEEDLGDESDRCFRKKIGEESESRDIDLIAEIMSPYKEKIGDESDWRIRMRSEPEDDWILKLTLTNKKPWWVGKGKTVEVAEERWAERKRDFRGKWRSVRRRLRDRHWFDCEIISPPLGDSWIRKIQRWGRFGFKFE